VFFFFLEKGKMDDPLDLYSIATINTMQKGMGKNERLSEPQTKITVDMFHSSALTHPGSTVRHLVSTYSGGV